MARTPTQPIEIIDAPTSAPATQLAIIAGQDAASAAQNAARIVAQQVGYQLDAGHPDADLIQRDIAANMRRSVESCLEVGRGLAVLKTLCGHGEFGARLEVLGIEDRVARRFMSAATKFSNRVSTPVLTAAGNQTKLFELLVLDDEQIEELAEDGATGSLKLDDVATMSVKELRLAVRKLRGEVGDERAEQDALRQRLGKRAEELELVRAKLERRAAEPVKPDELLLELLGAVTKEAEAARAQIDATLRSAVAAVQRHTDQHGGSATLQMGGAVGQVLAAINDLRAAFGLPLPAEADPLAWLQETGELDAANAANTGKAA